MRRSLIVTDAPTWTAEAEYAASVARAEAATGFEVTLAAPPGSAVASAIGGDVRVLKLPGGAPARSPADFVADVRFLSGLVAGEGFDVVHSSRSTAHVVAALAVGERAPLVHLRACASPPSGHLLNRFLYRRLTSMVLTSSERVRSWVVERLGIPPETVVTIHAPVDTERFRPVEPDPTLRRELGLGDGPLVVNVARLAPVKGHAVLIEAMAEVVKRVPDVVLVLVGEAWSGQLERLSAAAERHGIAASVVFTGRRTDVARIVASASVCVTSSIGSEENSRAVAEYMASGRPIVATSVGVIPELVTNGESGLLVPPNDVGAMAAGIVRLLTDRACAERMARSARDACVGRLSRPAFARALGTVLSRLGLSEVPA